MLTENTVKTLLLKPGELMLKGDNRRIFENQLIKNIKSALSGMCTFTLENKQGRFFIYIKQSDYTEQEIENRISKVFGIVSVSSAYKLKRSLDDLFEFLPFYANHLYDSKPFSTFRVTTKRADKTFPLNSTEISKQAGAIILSVIDNIKVDLFNPDTIFNIELRPDAIYVYSDQTRALGGIPVGCSGKSLLMLSGGIDSPVAAYMMAKRGMALEAVYFHSPPYTSEKAKQKVLDLCDILKQYTMLERLHVVDFTKTQMQIYEKCPHNELTVIMRRLMYMVGNKIAEDTGCKAFVTGEALAQVASQTVESLTVTQAAARFIVLRPLIGMDKNEIVDISKNIGTYETSILPYQDCCTVFVARHPKIKPEINRILESEKALDIETLVNECFSDMEVIDI